jgi:adenosylmethionine-8-amino-7-oxononanoate aminotransferase
MNTETRFWRPFADMTRGASSRIVITGGEGCTVTDADGKSYFDATASLWCVNAGHGRSEIVDAAAAQMRELASYSAFGMFTNRPAEELARRLAEYAKDVVDDPRVFFVLGGGDAVDTAAKLARRHFAATGRPERVHIISRTQGYHGTHGYGTSLGGIAANQAGMGPLDPATTHVPWDSLDALEAEIRRVGPERVAAVFAEPVVGAGGVHRVPASYLQGLQALCRRHGILFVADCVIAAFGRLGTWFGVDRFGLRPDMITFAKGVTSGYLPLGGVVVGSRVAETFWTSPNGVPGVSFRHGQTYSGHPTCCAAALANLDIIEREGLLARGRAMEDDIAAALGRLAGKALVGQIRTGVGALGAVAFEPQALAAHPDLPTRTFDAARARGVLVRPLGDGVAISPPLVATRGQIDAAAAVIGEAIAAVAGDIGGRA